MKTIQIIRSKTQIQIQTQTQSAQLMGVYLQVVHTMVIIIKALMILLTQSIFHLIAKRLKRLQLFQCIYFFNLVNIKLLMI